MTKNIYQRSGPGPEENREVGQQHRWRPGESGNPAGAPKRGESWGEIVQKIASMTPKQAAKHMEGFGAMASELAKLGDRVTLKEAVVLRAFYQMLFDPSPGLLTTLMDRSEGKVPNIIDQTMTHKVIVMDHNAQKVQMLGPDGQAVEMQELEGLEIGEVIDAIPPRESGDQIGDDESAE